MCVSSSPTKLRAALVTTQVLGFLVFALVYTCSANQGVAHAQDYASADRSAAALGHYARARAMLIEALAEFEEGKRLANPDLLIDAEQWRLTVVSRAEELNRVLDPKPRVTRGGVRYKANKRFIRHDPFYRNRNVGPKSSNTYWESEFKEKKQSVRARMIQQTATSAGAVTPPDQENVPAAAKAQSSEFAPINSKVDEVFSTVVKEGAADQQAAKAEAVAASPTEDVEQEIDTIVQNFASDGVEEDPELLQAIQDVVQSRLDDIDGQEPAPVTE